MGIGVAPNIAQCLDDFGIPYYLDHSVCELHGRGRLEGVTVVKIGSGRKPVQGSEKFIACDTLLLAVGLIPENELSRMAGIEIEPATNGPAVNEFMQTSEECVFAAGNVVVVYDLVDFVSREGERAGMYAARYAAGTFRKGGRSFNIVPGNNVRVLSPQVLTAGSDVTLYLRVGEPVEGKCQLCSVPDVFSKNLRYARPGEMNEAKVSAEKLAALPPDITRITISVEVS